MIKKKVLILQKIDLTMMAKLLKLKQFIKLDKLVTKNKWKYRETH